MPNSVNGQVIGGPTGEQWVMGPDGRYMKVGDVAMGGAGAPFSGAGQILSQYIDAQNSSQAAAKEWAASAVDPSTGRVLKQPTTQAQFQALQSHIEEIGNDQIKNTSKQQLAMLGYNLGFNAGGPTLSGGGAGGGAGGIGGGARIPAPQVDADVQGGFTSTLLDALKNPGIKARTLQDTINAANEGVNVASLGQIRANADMANASGMGGSGTQQAADTAVRTNAAGIQAGNARQISIDAEKARLADRQQSLGQAGQYVNSQQARQQSWYQYLSEAARGDRNMAINLLGQQRPLAPNLGGAGLNPGVQQPMIGGGANEQLPAQGGVSAPAMNNNAARLPNGGVQMVAKSAAPQQPSNTGGGGGGGGADGSMTEADGGPVKDPFAAPTEGFGGGMAKPRARKVSINPARVPMAQAASGYATAM